MFLQDTSFSAKEFSDYVEIVSKVATTIALLAGGFWGLWNYRKSQKLKAGEVLLKTEEEFRQILLTYEKLESERVYEEEIKPLLVRVISNELTYKEDVIKLAEFDRCLRFFVLCSVLDGLGIEQKCLAKAYYYYIDIFTNPQKTINRPELQEYLETYYTGLYAWMKSSTTQEVIKEIRNQRNKTLVNSV